ncbi:MAG: endonuclease/exonuclease/phosphatase family protein [Actinomycetota bacterium]|nr:endonuclease/exonuclease/phosphatase family protein [Actinomycetota bacterium]
MWSAESPYQIESFLKEAPADILCLQELTVDRPEHDHKNGPMHLAQALNRHCAYVELLPATTDQWFLANAVISRFPIVAQKDVLVNRSTGEGSFEDQDRAYLEVVIELGERYLTVGTTHLSYSAGFEITPRKRAEADALLSVIRERGGDYVFAGDLNATPNSYTVRNLRKILNHVGPDLSEATWTTKRFSHAGFQADSLEWRLDYVFASRDVTIHESRLIPTTYSDHLPILGDLELD